MRNEKGDEESDRNDLICECRRESFTESRTVRGDTLRAQSHWFAWRAPTQNQCQFRFVRPLADAIVEKDKRVKTTNKNNNECIREESSGRIKLRVKKRNRVVAYR